MGQSSGVRKRGLAEDRARAFHPAAAATRDGGRRSAFTLPFASRLVDASRGVPFRVGPCGRTARGEQRARGHCACGVACRGLGGGAWRGARGRRCCGGAVPLRPRGAARRLRRSPAYCGLSRRGVLDSGRSEPARFAPVRRCGGATGSRCLCGAGGKNARLGRARRRFGARRRRGPARRTPVALDAKPPASSRRKRRRRGLRHVEACAVSGIVRRRARGCAVQRNRNAAAAPRDPVAP